jgi:hypothetical protein
MVPAEVHTGCLQNVELLSLERAGMDLGIFQNLKQRLCHPYSKSASLSDSDVPSTALFYDYEIP